MAESKSKAKAASNTKKAAKASPSTTAKPAKAAAAKAAPKKVAATAQAGADSSAAKLIDQRIGELNDWRGEMLSRLRELILKADAGIIEEWKWNVPVWSCNGIICTGESYKKAVKLTFAKGASLPDPKGLFNSSLEGNTRRAIDFEEGCKIDTTAFKALIKAAVAQNGAPTKKATAIKSSTVKAKPKAGESKSATKEVVLLSGGNPQIAKGDGDAPVQAYIAAVPGWKQALAARLDKLIVKALPNVNKAVKWNSPFYGVANQGWFLNFHCFNKYIKVGFFTGTSLVPMPPKESKTPGVRFWDIYEDDVIDEAQFASWIKQASKIPGWMA